MMSMSELTASFLSIVILQSGGDGSGVCSGWVKSLCRQIQEICFL